MFAENWIRRSIARIAVGVQPPAPKPLYRRGGLSHALRHQLDRLDLEFVTELSSSHDHLRLDKTPKLGVHQTGSTPYGLLTAIGPRLSLCLKAVPLEQGI